MTEREVQGVNSASQPVAIGVLGLAPRSVGESTTGLLVRRVPLPRILYAHGLTRQTGVLALERDTAVRSVHLISGSAVWAESSEPNHRFSEWLVRSGTVTEDKAREAAVLVRFGSCRIGEALLRVSAISPSDLAAAAERFVLEVIVSAFEWRRGTYEFQPAASGTGLFEPPVHLRSPISAEHAIFQGFQQMTDVSLAAAWLGDLSAPRSFAADPFRHVEREHLTQHHVTLLAKLSVGCFSVAEVMEAGILDPQESLRFLGALDATGDLVTV